MAATRNVIAKKNRRLRLDGIETGIGIVQRTNLFSQYS